MKILVVLGAIGLSSIAYCLADEATPAPDVQLAQEGKKL